VGRVPLGASSGHTGQMSDAERTSGANPLVKLWHLTARFVTSLPPTPPSVDDEVWVDEHLLPGERALWIQLSNQDRRHSAAVARRFVRQRPAATRAEIAGAILHDVGKIECGLGTFGQGGGHARRSAEPGRSPRITTTRRSGPRWRRQRDRTRPRSS
jgi:hypothetical protein